MANAGALPTIEIAASLKRLAAFSHCLLVDAVAMGRLVEKRFLIGFAAGILLACAVLVPLGYYFASTLAVSNIETAILPPRFPPESPADYDWNLRRVDGGEVRMSEFKGKVVFLHFWATWCVPCLAEMPGIQRLYDRFREDERVAFVCVSPEKLEFVKSYIEAKGHTFPVFVMADDQPPVFRTDGLPSTFILSPDGKIAFSQVGTVKWDDKETDHFFDRLWSHEQLS